MSSIEIRSQVHHWVPVVQFTCTWPKSVVNIDNPAKMSQRNELVDKAEEIADQVGYVELIFEAVHWAINR